jgi:hypothetical protein
VAWAATVLDLCVRQAGRLTLLYEEGAVAAG